MALVRMTARREFTWGGRAYKQGDAIAVAPLDSAILHYRLFASFAPRPVKAIVPPPVAPPVIVPPGPDADLDSTPDPKLDDVHDAPRSRRQYRRRDLEPEK